ncbi:cell wall-binding repeat-containing protein [Planococcus maritimus]|uniref:cell wall-binding repeat-containing protein n=1 Tax=Planococcus maritimus TaxID=192421 RepID=UPI000794B9B9|nr:cell wall-binding repeat-containing protein [Planococcus maritimus]KYG59423.1 hypothetical protein AY633_04050 [Planococcus maritimus]
MGKLNLGILIILLTVTMISMCFQNVTNAESEHSVRDFGATGNGEVDDTIAIQNAIDFAYSNGNKTVFFSKGIYLVDSSTSLVVKDGIVLKFENEAILKAIPNALERSEVIRIHDVKNVKILGYPEIIGERDEHLGSTGEWGFGVSIRGAENIYIENAKISNFWGDGIYIGSTAKKNYNINIEINNVELTNNRRQGISIISVENLLIKDATITNTNGTSPQCGIDIEPNNGNERLVGIRIINLSTSNNAGSGLKFYLKRIQNNTRPIDIYVDSKKNIQDGISVREISGVNGIINVQGYYYLSDKEIVAEPTIRPINDRSTRLEGNATVYSMVTAVVDTKIIGSAKSNAQGVYSMTIPKQPEGKSIKLIAEDPFGNLSKEIIVVVEKFVGERPLRIAGQNRYETAIEISKKSWNNADTVLLTTGEDFPDALTGGPLGYKENAPILLTRSKSLNKETENEIERLKAKRITILGSEGAVSKEIENLLLDKGLIVERLGGANRYATAAIIAERLNSEKAIIGSGQNFPDILSISSYAAKNGIPILLTKKGILPKETKDALRDKEKTYVIGGISVINEDLLSELPAPERYGGANRYETSKAIIMGLPLGTQNSFIVTGINFPDALTGSALSAIQNAPIKLVQKDKIPEIYQDILRDYKAFTILGGTGVVGMEVENQLYQNLIE